MDTAANGAGNAHRRTRYIQGHVGRRDGRAVQEGSTRTERDQEAPSWGEFDSADHIREPPTIHSMLPFACFVFPAMVLGLLKNIHILSAVLVDHSPSSWRSNKVAP